MSLFTRCVLFVVVLCAVAACSLPTRAAETQPNASATCIEPFCTYAPPKLTGNGMAAAVREILSSNPGRRRGPRYRGKDITLEAFVNDVQDFEFISPYYVARTKDDPNLRELLGRECIEKLTVRFFDKSPPTYATGPVYLYRVKPSHDSRQEYQAILVYGFAPADDTEYLTFEERLEREQSGGHFVVLDPQKGCDPLYNYNPGSPARASNQFSGAFYPTFFGVGYYKHKFLLYSMQNIDAKGATRPYYRLQICVGWPTSTKPIFLFSASTSITEFPPTFDPFTIVKKQEPLP